MLKRLLNRQPIVNINRYYFATQHVLLPAAIARIDQPWHPRMTLADMLSQPRHRQV